MKRERLFIYLGMSFIFISSLLLTSCQKENSLKDNSGTKTGISIGDLQLEKKIIDFRNQITFIRENPTLKSGGNPWEIEDAIYYIEALANYTYGLASYAREGYTIDSSFISVPLTDGLIPAQNITGIYDKVIDSLRAHNDRITAQNKQLIVVDISLSGVSGIAATFKVSSGFGTSNGMGIENDYSWYWGWELGRCDESGLGEGKDAADKIMELANYNIGIPSGNTYYDNVSYEESTGCEYLFNNECALFEDFQEVTLVHQCLTKDDIHHYKNGLIYVGDLLKPTGKSIISFHLEDWTAFSLCGEADCWLMVHHADIKYGTWHYNSNPPEEL